MTDRILEFFVPGIPAPGGSKKAFIPKGWSRAVVTEAGGKKNKDWRAAVALAAYEAIKNPDWADEGKLFYGPLMFSCTFVMPRPKAHFNKRGLKPDAPRYPITRPDTLKLARSTEDALTGVVWADDSQVAVEALCRVYGEKTGAFIKVQSVEK